MATRRAVLTGLAVAAASPALAARRGVSDALDTYVALKADRRERPVAMAYRADIFMRAADGILPLLVRVEGLSWTIARRLGLDRWQFDQVDAGHYLDASSGAALASFMPPRGTATRVRPYRTPGSFVASHDRLEAPKLMGRTDVTLELARSAPQVIGDEIVMTEDLQTRFAGTRDGRVDVAGTLPRGVSQFTTFSGPARQSAAASIDSTAHAVILTDSRPWLPDLATPLSVMWRMTARKLRRIGDAPASTRAWLAAVHPDLLEAPFR